MNWETIANLVIQIGLPATEKLIALWESKAAVTLAEFQALRAQAQLNASDEMSEQLKALGIALDSPQAIALLKLVS